MFILGRLDLDGVVYCALPGNLVVAAGVENTNPSLNNASLPHRASPLLQRAVPR